MQIIDVTLKGLGWYLMNKPTQDKTPRNKTEEKKVAMNRVYQDEKGVLFCPARQIIGTMVASIGMQKLQIQRSIQRAKDLVIGPACTIEPIAISFVNSKHKLMVDDLELHQYMTHLDMGKIKWLWYACVPTKDWKLKFKIKAFDALQPDWLKECLEHAGLLCKIGGRRKDLDYPQNGAFEIVEFKNN